MKSEKATPEKSKVKSNSTQNNNEKNKWIPICERESINPIWVFAICANQIAINFVWAPLSVLTAPMCTKLGLSNKSLSLVMMMGSVIGLIIPPFISALSDSTTFKFGRRRIYLIIGEIFTILGLLMISFCREMSSFINPLSFLIPKPKDGEIVDQNNEGIIYFIAGQILATVGGNLAGVPGSALISDVIPSSQKVLSSSFVTLDYAISASISNAIGAFKLHKYVNLTNETFVLLVSCVIGIFAMTVSVVSSPEERLLVKNKSANPITVLIDSVRSIDIKMFFVIFSTFLYNFGCSQFYSQGANYVARFIFGGVPNAPDGIYDSGISYYQLLMLVLTLSQFVFSIFNTKLINSIGFELAWILANVSQSISSLLLFLVPSKEFLFVPYLLAGFASCVVGSVPYAYISLNAPSEKSGEYITLLILTFNISGILSNFLLQMQLGSLDFFQSNPGRLIVVGSVFFVFSIICAKIGFHDEKMKKKNE